MNFHPYAGPILDHKLFRVNMIEYFLFFFFGLGPWERTKDKQSKKTTRQTKWNKSGEITFILLVIKCSTSLRFFSPRHFISHGVSSSLNAYFESVNELMDCSHSIKTTSFLRWSWWAFPSRCCSRVWLLVITRDGGMLKCPTSLRFPSPWHFISHGVSSYLNASFESVNRPMNFSHGIKATDFLRRSWWAFPSRCCPRVWLLVATREDVC